MLIFLLDVPNQLKLAIIAKHLRCFINNLMLSMLLRFLLFPRKQYCGTLNLYLQKKIKFRCQKSHWVSMPPYNQAYSWDKGIHLLAHGMILFRYLIWGKGGNISVFSTECYKSMLASNVTGWPVTCECLTVVTKKLCWVHKRGEIREHPLTNR